jgi:diguanylate cyclase (GGDEF)-like protein
MMQYFRDHFDLDPSEWIMNILSWVVYFGGLIFFSRMDSSWVLIALGGLPVIVTGWTFGMRSGFMAAVVSILSHLIVHLYSPETWNNLNYTLFRHLVGFALLAIAGMLIGNLRDLQRRTHSELTSLRINNQKLVQLSRFLETVNNETTSIIAAQEWTNLIPKLVQEMGTAAACDHLFLFRLSGNGPINYSAQIYHSHKKDESIEVNKAKQGQYDMPAEVISWISESDPGKVFNGKLSALTPETLRLLECGSSGLYALFPIFANAALWGFMGIENNQPEYSWDDLELKTYQNAAFTLGSTFYKKLIEEDLNMRARELESLQKTSTDITSSDHIESGLHTVLSQIMEITPAYDTNIYLYQNKKLRFLISLGNNRQQSLPFSHPGESEITQYVASSNQDLYLTNVSEFSELETGTAEQHEALISFSLRAASEVIGVLNVWFPSERKFTRDEKKILRLLADQAATAILTIQFIQNERDQRIMADSLRNANLQLSDNLNLKQVLDSILEQVLNLVSARDAHLFLYNGSALQFGAVTYNEDVQRDPVHPPSQESIFYQTARQGERILIPDIQAEPSIQDTWKTGSLISLPLIFHRNVIGVMNVSFYEPGEKDEQLLQVLDLLSNQAAIAINNARTFEAEREQRKLAQALQKTGQAIQSSLDLEVVLDQILTQIGSVIEYHSANLMLVEDGFTRVVRQHGYKEVTGEEPDELFLSPFRITRFSTLQKMTETKKPLIIPDTNNDPQWVKTRSTATVKSWVGAPIIDEDHVIGFLSLNNQTRNYYNPEHAKILAAFASQASIALKHAHLHQEIRNLAIRDPLTGIYNRRGLDQWGLYEIERAERYDSPISAIFFDLDQFKNINDTYGHDVGDSILQQVVTCCKHVIRKIDIFARIGGEEFIILLPETPLSTAIQVAERIRSAVSEYPFQAKSNQIQVTLSLGIAELNDEVADLPALIKTADQYMYQAKRAGRNTSAYPTN